MSKPTAARLLNRLPNVRAKTAPAQTRKHTNSPPTGAAGWRDLALQLINEKRTDEAREAAEQAREQGDDSPALWLILARVEALADNTRLAISHFREVIERDEKQADAHHGLASALQRINEWNQALKHIELTLTLDPHRLTAKSLKALILIGLHRQTEAIALFEELLAKDNPQAAYAHLTNLGNAQRDVGKLAEAEQAYRKAVALRPDDVNSRSNLLTLLHYMPERTASEIEQVCREIGALFAKDVKSERPLPRDNAPNKRLRVGMFSDGFRQHPVGAMTATALEQLVKQGVDLYAYSTTSVSDYITERIKAFCTCWQVVTSLTDDQFVQQIREDEIDVLIDLAGYGAGTHMRALTQAPAPLIVKWVGGLINTTGLESIDYLITDAIESPAGTDHTYTEKLIRMPDDYICYMPPARVPNVGPLPASKNGYVTFGCFNNPTKINPVVLGEWASLLKMLPESRLLLKSGAYDSPIMRKMVTDTMLAHGVTEDRIQFSGYSIHYALFQAYNDIDIALDPWPYSGGLTTCEAMLMGVPVVTMPGPTFAGRHSATHLVNAGMPELVAADWDEYRARAIELAGNLDSLAILRSHLRETLQKSPVCDGARFAGHLAIALRAIWQRYCEGKTPAALHIAKGGTARFEGEDAPVKLLQPTLLPEEEGFQWQLPGKLIALDSGGRLLDRPSTEGMLSLRMLEAVVFDPASTTRDHALVAREDVHHQPGMALGDGEAAVLHDCLDPKLSSLLLPLDAESANPAAPGRVLFQRQVPTIALDKIVGLPAIDWLLLGGQDSSAAILAHGEEALARTLLIDARVVFQPTHAGQPTLAEVTQWASQHGFRLHRLHAAELGHASDLPGSRTLPPSALVHADALFVPNGEQMSRLDAGQRQKLACILHMGYGLEDAAYEILARGADNAAQAQDYLDDRYLAKATHRDAIVGVHNVRSQNEAHETANIARKLPRWDRLAVEVLIKRCVSVLEREPRNDTAHFLLSHALLAKGELEPIAGDTPAALLLHNLSARLGANGGNRKGTLYSHWLSDSRVLQDRPDAKISVVLVADGYKEGIELNLRTLREQGQEAIEIVLLNNGAAAADFAQILPLLDVYVETRSNAGAYLSRNLAAIHTQAPVLLFLESDGKPAPDLLQSHIDAHRKRDVVAVRGAYRLDGKKVGTPPHYDLGDKVIESLPTLDGNASFSREAFFAVEGWGDYLLSEHGGIDIGIRLLNHGYAEAQQVYIPNAVLELNEVRGRSQISDDLVKQQAPWRLLEAWGTTRAVVPEKRGTLPTKAAARAGQRALPTVSDGGQQRYLHICYNNMHVQGLINLLGDAALGNEFVHQIFIERRQSVIGYNNDIADNTNAFFFDKQTDFQKIVDLCLQPGVQGVFVHGLFFDWQKALIKAIGPQVKVIWGIWGGDLYGPINAGQPITDVVEHVDAVASVTEGDYRLFCETYGEKPRLQIMYPPAIDFDSVAVPETKSNVIFVGNSGDPGNLHGEILQNLAAKGDIEQYEIVLPMSYNSSDDYQQSLMKLIDKLGLTKQTRLLTEFIPLDKYSDMLADAKFLITAHHRQQALGNMVSALYCGTATVLRKNILVDGKEVVNPSWEVLTQMHTQPLSYEDFAACKSLSDLYSLPALSAEQVDAQRAALRDQISRAAILKLLKSQFDLARELV